MENTFTFINKNLKLNLQTNLNLSRDINKILISKLLEAKSHPLWQALTAKTKKIGKLPDDDAKKLSEWEKKFMQKLENDKINNLFDAYKNMNAFTDINDLTKTIKSYAKAPNFSYDVILQNDNKEIETKIVNFYNFMANFIKEEDLLSCISKFAISETPSIKIEAKREIIVNFNKNWYDKTTAKKMFEQGEIATADPFALFVKLFLEAIINYLIILNKQKKFTVDSYGNGYYNYIFRLATNTDIKNSSSKNESLLLNFIFVPAISVWKTENNAELLKEAFAYFYLTPKNERTVYWEYLIYFFTKQMWYKFYKKAELDSI